ncbi:MAG: hypothetical protein IMX02_06275 [Limnochordaceae bacterium]|nr:hypothetical protein [Limnochordaceae bacterium]
MELEELPLDDHEPERATWGYTLYEVRSQKRGEHRRYVERLRLTWREPLDPDGERWAIVARSLPPSDAPPGYLAWAVLASGPSLVATGRRAWAHYLDRHPEAAKGRMFSQKPERPTPQALALAGLIVRHLQAVREAMVRERGLSLPDDWADANVPGSVFWVGETLDSIRRAVEAATGQPLRLRHRWHLAGRQAQKALRVKPGRLPSEERHPERAQGLLPFEALLVRKGKVAEKWEGLPDDWKPGDPVPEEWLPTTTARMRQAVRQLGEWRPDELGLPIRLSPARLDRAVRRHEEECGALTIEAGEARFDRLVSLVWLSAVHGVEARNLFTCVRCGGLGIREEGGMRRRLLCDHCLAERRGESKRSRRLAVEDDALQRAIQRARVWIANTLGRAEERYLQENPAAAIWLDLPQQMDQAALDEAIARGFIPEHAVHAIRAVMEVRRRIKEARALIHQAIREGWDADTFEKAFDKRFGRQRGRGRPRSIP